MDEQDKSFLYFDIPKEERDYAISYLLDSLEKSKASFKDKNTAKVFDRDVQIYLAHLLFAASMPDYQEAVQRYVSLNVQDIIDFVQRTDDQVIRYFIYKINADYLLIHLGIFGDLEDKTPLNSRTAKEYVKLAKSYYEQAAQYHKKIYKRPTAIGLVLDKLAGSFETCAGLLHAIRRDFFNFSNGFRDKEFSDFYEQMNRYEKQTKLDELMDSFLDLYLQWSGTGEDMLKHKLEQVGKEIKGINPEFRFDLNKGRKAA